jgi:hypothetical protein
MSPARNTRRARRHLALAFGVGLAVTLPVACAFIDAADGATLASPGYSAYATYPAGAVPAGCSGASFTGNAYSQTHAGATTQLASLRQILRLDPGDVITWTFTGSGTCTQATLALKDAPGPTFDPSVDQRLLLPYGALPVSDGQGGTVSYTVGDDTCFAQLDAVAGPPLAVIGPHGSYYTSSTRTQNGKPGGVTTLVDAWNGAIDGCNTTPTTSTPPTTAPPATTTTTSSSTSAPPSTTTTAPAVTTSTPSSTSSTQPSTPTSTPPPASSTTEPPPPTTSTPSPSSTTSAPSSTTSSRPALTSTTAPAPTTTTTATEPPTAFAYTGAYKAGELIAFALAAIFLGLAGLVYLARQKRWDAR